MKSIPRLAEEKPVALRVAPVGGQNLELVPTQQLQLSPRKPPLLSVLPTQQERCVSGGRGLSAGEAICVPPPSIVAAGGPRCNRLRDGVGVCVGGLLRSWE